MLQGLQDPVLMQKKRAFEKTIKEKVQSNDELNNKYGTIWTEIENAMSEMKELSNQQSALSYDSFDSPEYFSIATQLIQVAEDLKLSETDSSYAYTDDELNESIDALMPEDFDFDKNNELLINKIDLLYEKFGDDEFLKKFTNGKKGNEAVEDILERSIVTSTEMMKKIVKEGPDAVLNSDDPFIEFIQYSDQKSDLISIRIDELATNEASSNQKLGRALFEVYGTSIPPDATFTLRISDGIVKGFNYNGTIAPPIATFYGLLDRYYSFDGKFPWNLHERWLDAPDEFDFSTPFNFVTTNDAVGGNSGSPIINKNAEVVGVAFDGNIQSLPGDFIYDPEVNRSVGVHSAGMLEAIKDLYRFERLADELQTGKGSD
jgi:hypothetical protein